MVKILDELGQEFNNPVANNSRGERNNNQGNIEDGPYARSQPGYIGSDGRFARFSDPNAGANAQVNLIRDGKRYKGKPISGIIQIYAPPSSVGGDNSEASVRNYIGYVAQRAGIDPDGVIPAEKYGLVAKAMGEFETGRRAKGVKFSSYGGTVGGGGMSRSGAGGGYNAGRPGVGVADPQSYLKGLESSLAPETKASENVRQNSAATFGSDKELGTRADAVENQITQQGKQIDILDQVMEVSQNAAREAMTRQVQETRDVSAEIQQGTQELKAKVLPIFQTRGRIADQLDKLATMNPLERGLRAVFDTNYDKDHLEGQLDSFDRTLKARSDDYNYLNNLHGVALQEINRRYSTDTAIPALMQEQAKEDLGLVGMRLTQTSAMLGSLKDRIGTESQMIAAKQTARQDLMSRLDIPTITDLMTKAGVAGGVVQFNGVEFSYKELRDRVQASEQQDLATEAYKMSIASNRMDMANKYAVNLASSLTRGQLEAAMQNGGVHNGVQMPQDVLTNLYQSAVGRDTTRAQTVANEMPASLALNTGADYLKQTVGLYERGKSMFGYSAMEGSGPVLSRGSQLVRRLTEAVNNNEPPEVLAALTQQVAQNSAEYTKFVDNKILTQVGGDKRAAGYMRGFLYGTQLDPGTAGEAMAYFAMKGNLPQGLGLTPEVKQVFQKAQKLVTHHQSYKENGQPLSAAKVMQRVQADLNQIAPQIMGQARHDKLYSDITNVAKAANHPLGAFPAQKWGEIQSRGHIEGVEALANKVKATPQDVATMLNTKKPLGPGEDNKLLFDSVMQNASIYNAIEQQTISRLIDKEPWVQRGVANSDLLVDFLGSPQLTQGLSTYTQSLGSSSFGEYLTNPMQATSLHGNFASTRKLMQTANSQIASTDLAFTRDPMIHQLLQPNARTKMILSAIPGVSQEGAQVMEPIVGKFFDSWMKTNTMKGVTPNEQFVKQDAAFRNYLQGQKFENPQLEAFRKSALKGWETHATEQKNILSRILEATAMGGSGGREVVNSGEYDINGNRR